MTRDPTFEPGAIAELSAVLAIYESRRVFLITAGDSYQKCGAKQQLDYILARHEVTQFSGIQENPSLEQLQLGLDLFSAKRPDIIIAVGGGSVIDMAKLIRIFAAQPQAPLEYIRDDATFDEATLPLIAIPTTAGSGSQATHFAVLYIGTSKHSVAHPSMLPDVAIVDPEFLKSMTPAVAASTGLDALNQGIESYWNVHSTLESKEFAREAIELIWNNLARMVQSPDQNTRQAMATGAHRAGQAINITKTTAPHAISYPITAYFGVPHGHAVGLVMSRIIQFNNAVTREDCLDTRGPDYVRTTIAEISAMLDAASADEAARAYDNMMDEIGLCRNLGAVGIRSREHLETIIKNGFNPQRVNNNPRKLTASALRDLLIHLQDCS